MTPLKRLYSEEDGQALLYGAGMLVLLVALFLGMMDIGRLVLGKIEAQNAADAAAMSASALKASVHNTRSLAYRAMTGQIDIARARLIEATGLALDQVAGTNSSRKDHFLDTFKKAQVARSKAERLRNGLLAFNAWVTGPEAGPNLARQAAEVGYLGNAGTLSAQANNLHLLEKDESFPENSHTFGTKLVGGVTYTGEALGPETFAGKSLVRLYPQVGTVGGSILHYDALTTVDVEAAAGPVPASKQYGSMPGIAPYGIEWYTVRLMPVGVDPDWKK